ncbi:unnamed protein product, partial [Dibothriocephalus latus]
MRDICASQQNLRRKSDLDPHPAAEAAWVPQPVEEGRRVLECPSGRPDRVRCQWG